jgi:HSP20 family protein
MNLARLDPFRDLETLSSRLNRLFNQPLATQLAESEGVFGDWTPAMDIEETDKEYLVKADLPAIKREDVKVQITEGVLTVEGERKQEKEERGKKFHKIERSFGKFVRRLAVPSDVDEQKISAEFKEGVLNVHLPKSAVVKPRSVDVKVA